MTVKLGAGFLIEMAGLALVALPEHVTSQRVSLHRTSGKVQGVRCLHMDPSQSEHSSAKNRAGQGKEEEGQDVSDEDVIVHRQRAP